jgi:hypothetical protein
MEEEKRTPPPVASNEEYSVGHTVDGAVDLDTQAGLRSPTSRHVTHAEQCHEDPVSFSDLEETGEGESESESGSEAGSEDSFILDLFHGQGAEEYTGSHYLSQLI